MTPISLESTLFLAQAAPAGAQGGPFGSPLMFPVLMIVLMYFVIFRPQQKRMKEHQKLVSSIAVDDHVIMESGVHGIITSIKDRTVMVKIADNVKVQFERSKIAAVTKKSDVVDATAS
ncbi:preprotein translocase subunit YajC [Prosthecobacter vanneervenii]|uniref:Sec translocon accessory complex subunit YajC n=1 Tax=Prosthecobacter vanneervenii TaxID=48466 RepID=A0A7W7YDH5_9BACT|nr:preprotein translocase subunit YajC [Prosthecobacter vanneervenii]MBB5034168.1 preprotein translocase subunit YajC [Prosthecobacter vanneervenii]